MSSDASGQRMLEVRDLGVSIAAVQILRGVSLAVPDQAMIGLIGRNGAGKTTLMKTLMGLHRAASGSVQFDGRDLLAQPTHARVRLGIGYMPEDRRLIPDLTVEENVLVPAWAAGLADARERLERVYGLIPEMRAFAPRKGLALSGGQQKLAALARALIAGTTISPIRWRRAAGCATRRSRNCYAKERRRASASSTLGASAGRARTATSARCRRPGTIARAACTSTS